MHLALGAHALVRVVSDAAHRPDGAAVLARAVLTEQAAPVEVLATLPVQPLRRRLLRTGSSRGEGQGEALAKVACYSGRWWACLSGKITKMKLQLGIMCSRKSNPIASTFINNYDLECFL